MTLHLSNSLYGDVLYVLHSLTLAALKTQATCVYGINAVHVSFGVYVEMYFPLKISLTVILVNVNFL